jgi:phenylacetate-coenzyme A ligase PaaK-like adenylate-forming protein
VPKNFTHKIHLKDNNPVYRKQFKIPEAHQNFIEATLDELLKLGVVKRSNSLYNYPLFCVPKNKAKVLELYKTSVN